MDVDRERLPQWGWLLGGLFALAMLAFLVNQVLLGPLGLPVEYYVVTTIAAMSPVLIFVGIWFDEDRQEYWEHSRYRIVGDVLFVVAATALGAAFAAVFLVDLGLNPLVRELLTMFAGFATGWVLFWFRNPEVYRD